MSNGFKPRGFTPNQNNKDPFDDFDDIEDKKTKLHLGKKPDKDTNKKPKVSIKYKNSMSNLGWIVLACCVVITILSVCIGGYSYYKYSESKVVLNEEIGTQVVNDLFSWGTVQVKDGTTGKMVTRANMNQVNANMKNMKNIMTEQAYNNNTLENGEAVLGLTKTMGPQPLPVYLETGQHACRPNIVKQGPGYVVFTLVSPNISPSRMFEISYTINSQGKIDWMLQAEIAPMLSYSNSEWA